MYIDEYTRLMMKRSTIPEIAALVNANPTIDDYWNDTSDNIQIEENIDGTTRDFKLISKKNKNEKRKKLNLSLPVESHKQDLISPNLTYDVFVLSPSAVCFEKNLTEKSNIFFQDKDENKKATEKDYMMSEFESPVALKRIKCNEVDQV